MKSTTTPRKAQGARIRALRESAGLTVRDLAERVGIHPQSLRNIELGKRPASDATLEAIAHNMGASVTDITGTPARAVDADETVPDFRLYTHEEGAALIGGGITANLLRRLATAGVEHTRLGGKALWTLDQLRAVVAEHAVTGPTTRTRKTDAATTRRTSSGGTRRPRTNKAPANGGLLAANPGRRYQQSA